jgi:hypothetical protein
MPSSHPLGMNGKPIGLLEVAVSSLYCRNMPNAEGLLRAIARDEKKRVQRCEFYDRNVCDFEFTDLKVRVDPISKKYRVSAPLIRSGGPLTSKVALVRAGHPVLIWANSETMLISVLGQQRIQTKCSINGPNSDDFKLTKHVVEGLLFPVFIRSAAKPTKEVLGFLSSPDVQRSVQALITRDTGSLHFRIGEVALYLHPQSAEEATDAIEKLLTFVGPFRPQREEWNLVGLPSKFQHLVPMIKKWAESDDSLRSDLIGEAGEPSLRELIENVAPLFDSINTYLDSFGDDLPEAAIALQTLAESAAEARMAIKDRGDRN